MTTKNTASAGAALALLLGLLVALLGQPRRAFSETAPMARDASPPGLVLYAGPPGAETRYTPPPEAFLRRAPHTAVINVNFVGAWDAQAQAAIQYAAAIWETQITSPVPIAVNVSWTALGNNVLGSANASAAYLNFPGAPRANTWYPAALANKLAGADLNGASVEIEAAFNSAFGSWYYGTDGNPPTNTWDLVTVALHELGHGLGFSGSMIVDDGAAPAECTGVAGVGCWGNGSGYPYIYDTFTQNGSGTALLAFPNNSAALGAQLTSNNVFFDSPNADAANGNAPVELYAPASWVFGSSYSHLGNNFNGTLNALMTYSVPGGAAIHDPGPVTRGMFADMGWTVAGATPTPSPTSPPSATPTATAGPSATPPPAQDAFLPLVMQSYSMLTPTPTPLPSDWLGYLNGLRAIGGIPSVSETASWSSGCTLHARYMVKNDVIGHSEDPANPWYTAEGAAAAQNSNVMASTLTSTADTDALALWMTGAFHGIALVDPALQSTGFGSYREAVGQWQMGACLDVLRGLGVSSAAYPLTWPADGERMPFAMYGGNEQPDPLTTCAGYTAPSGAPIYLLLGPGWSVTPSVTASAFTQAGSPLAHCVIDSATYTNPDAAMQQLGRDVLAGRDAVVLIPKDPLIPGASYTASITVNGQTYTWSFTVERAALRRIAPAEMQMR